MWFFIVALMLAMLPRPATALIDPLPVISQFESSGGTNTTCSATGACGIFQDVKSTWKTALQGIGIDPSLYPNANAAPASVQLAANAWLVNKNGLSDWTCPNCDPPFSAYVAANGGPSAFQTSGLSTNPADYTQYDSNPAALKTYLASGGTANFTGAGNGGPQTFQSFTTPGSSVSVAPAFHAFQWVWDQYQNGVQATLTSETATIQSAAFGLLGNLILLMILLTAIGMMFRLKSWEQFISYMMRAAIVILLLGSQNYYGTWITGGFTALSNFIGSALGLGTTGPSQFDLLATTFFVKSGALLDASPALTGAWFEAVFWVALSGLFFAIIMLVLFGTWYLSQSLAGLVFLIGPLAALTLLFDATRHIWDNFLSVLLHLALTATNAVILAALTLPLMTGAFNNVAGGPGGSHNLFAVVLAIFGLGSAAGVMPWVISYICRGAIGSVAAWRGSNTMVSTIASHAMTAGGVAARAVGISRATSPALSSLSRG